MTALVTVYWLCFAIGLLYVLLAGVLGAVGHGHVGAGQDADAPGDVQVDAGGMEAADLDAGDYDVGGLDVHAGLDTGGSGLDAGGHLEAAPMDMGGAGFDVHADVSAVDAGHALAHVHGGVHGHGHAAESHGGAAMEYSPLSPLSLMGFLCAFGATGLIATAYSLSTLVGLILAAGGGVVMALVLWLIVGKLLFGMQGSSEAHQADMIGLEAEVLTPVEGEMSGEIAYVLDGVRYTSPARLTHAGIAAKSSTVRIKRITGNVVYVEEKRKILA